MMKKILFSILSVLLLTSCYKDKGSYDYRFDQMNEIDLESISFTPEAYQGLNGSVIEIQQPLDADLTQRIEVKLKQTLFDNCDKLDFLWRRSYQEGGVTKKDTLYTQGYVELEFPVMEQREYNMVLEIKDPTTTLTYYKQLTVKTRELFKNSLFVLHGNNGNTLLGNVEQIGDKTEVRINAYKTAHPDAADNPFGKAIGLGYSSTYNDWTMTYSNSLCAYNPDNGRLYDAFQLLQPKYDPGYVLPLTGGGEPFLYYKYVMTGDRSRYNDARCLLSQDGRFYIGGRFLCFHIPGKDTYDPMHQTDYKVTAATISEAHYVFWDEKNSRFLYLAKGDWFGQNEDGSRSEAQIYNPVLDAMVDFSSLGDLSPVGKKGVYAYISSQTNFEEAHPYFLLRDDNGFYLYELTPVGGKKSLKSSTRGGDEPDQEPAFTITGKKLKNFNPGRNLASICYNIWFSTNYIFYADGDKVYRYNTSNGDLYIVYSAPSGYTISTIKFRTCDAASAPGEFSPLGDLGLYMSIGMNKGEEGAVAEVKLTTSADLDETFTPIFASQDADGNKFGKIVDLQFAYKYMYSKDH